MKTKLSNKMKFLIVAIAAVLAAIAVFGFSNIQAEPTIEDLAKPYVHDIGTFKPSSKYDGNDENLRLVSWLSMTQLTFNHDMWGKDIDEDGTFSSQDVYLQEGFETKMQMLTNLYPIFEINEQDNYFIIPLSDYEKYNGVLIELAIAENNDLGRLKAEDTYWLDKETNYLYIDKQLISESIENEVFNAIRAETIMLVKDVNDMTKAIDVFTLFDENLKDLHGLDKCTPNETMQKNVMDWSVSGLKYRLVPQDMLPYVSAENLSVYVNYAQLDNSAWFYDEWNGVITIDCEVTLTSSVAVKFNKINDVDSSTALLQYTQSVSKDEVVSADNFSTIENAVTGNNPFLNYIKYDEAPPKVGDWQQLGYVCYVYADWRMITQNASESKQQQEIDYIASRIKQYDFNSKVPVTQVAKTIYKWGAQQSKDGEFLVSTTLTAYQSGTIKGIVPGYKETVDEVYGKVVYNMFLSSQTGEKDKDDKTNLNTALTWAQNCLLGKVDKGYHDSQNYYGAALTTVWLTLESGGNGGRFITGVTDDEFLGGRIPDDAGYAMFDAICCRIEAPNAEAMHAMGQEYGKEGWGVDYRSNATIVKVTEESVRLNDGTMGDGYVYICLWSQSLYTPGEATAKNHSQRILAFSRVPYKYNGTGKIELTKYSEDGQIVPGAVYSVTEIKSDGTRVNWPNITTDIAPVQTGELPQGTYEVKEISSPEGYLLNPQTYTVTVESGLTRVLDKDDGVVDPDQMCEFTMTVYDATTKNNSVKVGIPNITFDLYSTERGKLNTYTTDARGEIHGEVRTIKSTSTEEYYLKQTSTVPNYAMTTDESSSLYCDKIPLSAPASTSGQNTETILVHYEARQEMTIHSHVQDINIGEKSPSVLGGNDNGGSYVTLLGAQYNLKTLEPVLLGYTNSGNAVTAPAGTVLKIQTQKTNGSEGYATQAMSTELTNSGKAYVYALSVEYNGTIYPIPNGKYEWVLTNASSGYYMNGARTTVDAGWYQSNWRETDVDINTTPVKQVRQTVNIDLLAKSYKIRTETKTAPSGFTTTIKDNVPSLSAVLGGSYLKDSKSIYTKDSALSPTSYDLAVAYKANNVKVSVEANTLAPNFIYALYNKDEIVDINSGEKIAGITSSVKMQSQPLGFYLTNNKGEIHITKLGSDEFVNPNKESNESMPKIPKCDPKTINGTSTYGHAIPNGEYYLVPYIAADDYRIENILSEDSTYSDLKWVSKNSNKPSIATKCAVYLWHQIGEGEIIPTVAPDAPILDTTNPDPQNPSPDDVGIFPDGTKITLDWIKNNSKNIAYRIFDADNIDGDVFEISDTLPTTFGFYAENKELKDPLYTYTYHFNLFYEVSQSEYNTLSASERFVYNGTYYRKFDTDGLTQADRLNDIIKFNTVHFSGLKSPTEVNDNTAIAGMIYNTDWLNEKMREQTDGTYKLLFQIKVSYSYESKFSHEPIHVDMKRTWNGELVIKNRQLVNLD